MHEFPWKACDMTWVHYRFFVACETLLSEKQNGSKKGHFSQDIKGDTDRFDRMEQAFRSRGKR